MKKMLFAALTAAVVLFASCAKDQPETVSPDGNGPQVLITLTGDNATRAFFQETAGAEVWEKEITSLSVYVLNQSGNIILRRSLTTAEVQARSATITLPNSAAGASCSFYALANSPAPEVANLTELENLVETVSAGAYNGTFAQTTTGRTRADGFVMAGYTTSTAVTGNTTTVGITLKRVVAKVAVRVNVAPDFAANYSGGTVVINNMTVSNANSKSYTFDRSAGPMANDKAFSFTQVSEQSGAATYDNLFYIYESPAQSQSEEKVVITLAGYFDADGNTATTNDRADVEYKIVLDGAGNGAVKRNGYYRVDGVIWGLSGDGVIVNFTVADWESPVTQNINLGV